MRTVGEAPQVWYGVRRLTDERAEFAETCFSSNSLMRRVIGNQLWPQPS